MTLSTLGLTESLVGALTRAHQFQTASAIQSLAIPALLLQQDATICAPTGSGKTLAYGLPLLQHLMNTPASSGRMVRALVLVPTRELAAQVGQTLRAITQQLPVNIRVHAVYGGVSINPQMLALRAGTDLLIATPGRLLDLVAHNAVQLEQVRHLVLDEADRMLALGFADELQQVLQHLPAQRQNVFLSATMPPAAQQLASALLHNPVHLQAPAAEQTAPDITQRAFHVEAPRRTQLLRHLMDTQAWSRVLVFVATKLAAEIVADKLRRGHIAAEPFHGELSQGKRTQVLQDFQAGRIRVVVATDVAARGLDIAQLPVVVNFDLPRSAADYTHRIGRTGRAGASGLAVSFVHAENAAHFALIRKRHRLALALETQAGFEPSAQVLHAVATQANTPGTGGIKGKRVSKKDRLRAQAAAAAATTTAPPNPT